MRVERITVDSKEVFHTPICACIGNFDGMHRGHQKLIERAIELSRLYSCDSAMFTFDPDPEVTITGRRDIVHITSLDQRLRLAEKYGIETAYVLDFSPEMAGMEPMEFLEGVLGRTDLKALVCGFDFRFGKKGSGDAEFLKEHADFEVSVVEEIKQDGIKISSTDIIASIRDGEVDRAEELMGHPYAVEGKVCSGKQLGRTIGFPTANIQYDAHSVLPKIGVYAGFIYVNDSKYMTMVNLGHNPTFNFTEPLSLEAHILDFNKDIYGCDAVVELKYYLRPEMKFQGAEHLKRQLENDTLSVRRLLENEL